MSQREVTEFDLRAPEFQRRDIKPEDYEFRDDGNVVRKDRWETGLRNVASALGWARKGYEIPEVVAEVRRQLDRGVDGEEEYASWAIVHLGVQRPARISGPVRAPRHCQSQHPDKDVCHASQRDGVLCPDGECDIDTGLRLAPGISAPALEVQGAKP